MTSPTSQLRSTILITGGNGSLGSAIALQIAESQPRKHHLILTARSLTDPRTISASSKLKSLNASFEFQVLDLSSLENVSSFAATIRERINKNEIPALNGGGVVLSAAMTTQVKNTRTRDGWSEIYGINVLAQVLLVRELLPVLKNALVVNVASAAHSMGTVDYFSHEVKGGTGGENERELLGLGQTMKRYGTSKLWGMMAFYGLQRRLDAQSNTNAQIVSLDPGGMSGDSNLGFDHWLLKFLKVVLGFINPVLRMVKKDAFNPPEVPAKAIADLFLEDRNGKLETGKEGTFGGKYFVLDDEVESSAASREVQGQEVVWVKVCGDLGLGTEV